MGEANVKLAFTIIMWSISFIASKHAMAVGFSEFTLAFARYVMVVAVLIPILAIKKGGLHLPLKKDWLQFVLSGLTGITVYFICEYMGVKRVSVVNAALVLALIPVISILYGVLRGRKYPPANWLGVMISLVGVFLVVAYGKGGMSAVTGEVLFGNLMLFGAVICWVAYLEISGKLLERYDSLTLTTWQGVAGLIMLIPLASIEMPTWQPVPFSGWLAVAFLAFVCSALCFFWYNQALQAVSRMRAAIFINLTPVVAAIAGYLAFGETLQWQQAVGGCLVLGSIWLVNRR